LHHLFLKTKTKKKNYKEDEEKRELNSSNEEKEEENKPIRTGSMESCKTTTAEESLCRCFGDFFSFVNVVLGSVQYP
jgi:hypothetical protein